MGNIQLVAMLNILAIISFTIHTHTLIHYLNYYSKYLYSYFTDL